MCKRPLRRCILLKSGFSAFSGMWGLVKQKVSRRIPWNQGLFFCMDSPELTPSWMNLHPPRPELLLHRMRCGWRIFLLCPDLRNWKRYLLFFLFLPFSFLQKVFFHWSSLDFCFQRQSQKSCLSRKFSFIFLCWSFCIPALWTLPPRKS